MSIFTAVYCVWACSKRMQTLLNSGDIVLVGCLGYSPSGEAFNCASEQVAMKCAVQLKVCIDADASVCACV